MSAHTPGCSCDLGHDHASNCPRGRLIAAAPRMLEVIRVMASALNPDQNMKDLCRAILRDVEGESND